MYYTRNAEINKRMIKELAFEAESWYINEDGGGDSDGDGSSSSDSEDEKMAESEKLKKALEDVNAANLIDKSLSQTEVTTLGAPVPQSDSSFVKSGSAMQRRKKAKGGVT